MKMASQTTYEFGDMEGESFSSMLYATRYSYLSLQSDEAD